MYHENDLLTCYFAKYLLIKEHCHETLFLYCVHSHSVHWLFANNGNYTTSCLQETQTIQISRVIELKGHREYDPDEMGMDHVCFITFSHNGKTVATAGEDYTNRIWDAESGKELKKFNGYCNMYTLILPDEKILIDVRLFDVESGEELQSLKWSAIGGYVISADFSPNGKIIVTGGGQTSARRNGILQHSGDFIIRTWDTESGTELKKLEGHTQKINSVAFSSDGNKIVSGSDDMTVRIWDVESGTELKKLEGYTQQVNSVAISPDGKKIVSGSDDITIRIWDVESGTELKKLEGHTGGVNSVAFSPDGKRIISGGYDTIVRIWDAESGTELKKLETPGTIRSVVFSPDGKRIAIAGDDGYAAIWVLE